MPSPESVQAQNLAALLNSQEAGKWHLALELARGNPHLLDHESVQKEIGDLVNYCWAERGDIALAFAEISPVIAGWVETWDNLHAGDQINGEY